MQDRRNFLRQMGRLTAAGLAAGPLTAVMCSLPGTAAGKIRTVLGDIPSEEFGVIMSHEHIPSVDWSELYGGPPAPLTAELKRQMTSHAVSILKLFAGKVSEYGGRPAVVDTTPIRVGRYPDLYKMIAGEGPVHLIGCTGFWGEGLAPMHPWAVELLTAPDGPKKAGELFVREITKGMENPYGKPGENFTAIRAGIIKTATSSYMTPVEKLNHLATAIACKETGCPITTHTTDGGGMEEADLFLEEKVPPGKIIIGHQGNLDDGKNAESTDYHKHLADMGCWLQFDRLGMEESGYGDEQCANQIVRLIEGGYEDQLLLSHDRGCYWYDGYLDGGKDVSKWKANEKVKVFTHIYDTFIPALKERGVSDAAIRKILVDNPRRALAFA